MTEYENPTDVLTEALGRIQDRLDAGTVTLTPLHGEKMARMLMDTLEVLSGVESFHKMLSKIFASVSDELLAEFIAAILPLGDEVRPNKELALALSDEYAIEEAQRLYHFAVLVTRMS